MSSEKQNPTVKYFTKFISDSSQKLLATFLNDDLKIQKEVAKVRNQIELACSQNSFVVLQIADSVDPNAPFETAAGKLRHNKNNQNIIILSDQKTQGIRMIPIDHIKKVSFLKPKLPKNKIAK